MTTPKPVIVIIHGAFIGPPHFIRLRNALGRAGFEVHVPKLPTGNGERPPTSSLKEDTEFIRSYVEKILDRGRDVIAVAHSYGGQVATNALAGLGSASRAARGLKGVVNHIIYMTALALPENTSAIDKVNELGGLDLLLAGYDIAEDMTTVARSPREALLGAWDNEAEADWYISNLTAWNGNVMYEKIESCAWREIPVSYVYTSKDNSIPLASQESMVEKLRAEGVDVKTVTLETGHAPHFTMPREIADIISHVAG